MRCILVKILCSIITSTSETTLCYLIVNVIYEYIIKTDSFSLKERMPPNYNVYLKPHTKIFHEMYPEIC